MPLLQLYPGAPSSSLSDTFLDSDGSVGSSPARGYAGGDDFVNMEVRASLHLVAWSPGWCCSAGSSSNRHDGV